MIGTILLICGITIGVLGMGIWYLLLRRFLKKNDGKNASEVEPAIRRFMTVSSLIAILFFILAVGGILLRNNGI